MVTQSFNVRKHKKKGLWALLLLLRSRRNLAFLAVAVVALVSLGVAVPATTLYKVPGFAKFLTVIGMAAPAEGSQKMSLAAMIRQAREQRALEKEKGAMLAKKDFPNGQYGSDTASMVVGGKDLWDRHTVVGAGKDAARAVKGVASREEKGADPIPVGDGVVDASLLGGGEGSGGGLGTFGSYGSFGNVQGGTPYIGSGSGGGGDGILGRVGSRIPRVGSVKQSRVSGRLSGFSWNNVSAARRNGAAYMIHGRKSNAALKQLKDVYASSMAGTRKYSMETKSVYASAPFDGQDLTVDTLGEDTGIEVPEQSSTFMEGQKTLNSIGANMETCKNATDEHATKASQIGKEMDELAKSPPTEAPNDVYNCGEISRWNSKMSRMYDLCTQYNNEISQVSNACYEADGTQDCSQYSGSSHLECKHRPSCGWLVFFLLFCFLLVVLLVVALGLILFAALAALGAPVWLAATVAVIGAVLAIGPTFKAVSKMWGIDSAISGMGDTSSSSSSSTSS